MLNEIWVTVFTLIKSIVGDVDVKSKGTLQKQIDDCFTSASNGKAAIASAITGKGVSTASDATFATMAANIGNIKTSPKLQAKNAALSTAAQTIKPDTGYDGLSQVSIPAVSGIAGTGDVLSGKTFSSGSAGISKTGTMPNKGAWTGTVAAASKITIPAGYHNGNGYAQCTDKGYNQGVTDADNRINTNSANYKGGYNAGVSAADGRVNTNSVNYKGGYNAGVSAADGRVNAESANYKGGYNAGVSATKKGTAGTGDVLAGKTFTNSSSVGVGGTMPNKGSTTQDAGAVTQDDTYTYLTVPSAGYYNTASKLRTKNSNLGTDSFFGLPFILSRKNSAAGSNQGSTNTAKLYLNGKYKSVSLTASGHITSSSSTGLKVTISANNGTETTELYTITNTGSNKENDYSIVIPAGTQYIEITVYHGSTGQFISYEVRLDSLTAS